MSRIARGENRQAVFSPDGVTFAYAVESATPPHALLLHAPAYNDPALLTGRRLLMGYDGHLWSHGLDYMPRKTDVQRMYAGEPDAPALLTKYGVRYVVVGPFERSSDAIKLNEAFWSRYPVVAQSRGGFRLLAVSPSGTP